MISNTNFNLYQALHKSQNVKKKDHLENQGRKIATILHKSIINLNLCLHTFHEP